MTAPEGALLLIAPDAPLAAPPPRVEPWRQERALMLHLVEVERAAVLSAGGTPAVVRA